MNSIRITRDNAEIEDIKLSHGELSIGRDKSNDLHFEHPYLSSHHAKIVTLFDASYIEDLGSTNGTFVNQKRVAKHTLCHGDVITFADLHITFASSAQRAPASDLQETMILESDDLAVRIKAQESANQRERPTTLETPAPEATQKQAADRPAPSIEDLELLRKAQQPATASSNAETQHKVMGKQQQSTQPKAATSKLTQRPVMQTSREELFKRQEEKKKLLSPVTVYFITVAAIFLVILLLLPYLPV